MLTGGRILVAIVGAVVLAVVAVFVVRSVWWDTASNEQPPSLPTAVTETVASTAETTAPQQSSNANRAGSDADTGTDQTTTETTTTEHSTETTEESTEQSEPYTATSEKVQRILGTVAVDVELPQVQGGDPDVAKVFNDGMQKVLETQADLFTGGTLESRSGTGVRIGKQVLSGLLRTAATDYLKGTSTALAGTVVVDTDSGSAITLSSLFSDENTGLQKLQQLSQELGPTTSAGTDFTIGNVQPSEQTFQHWTAESKGMRIYFAQGVVAPEAKGIVELTIPWDDLSDVLKPGVAQIVSS